jgi:Glycerol-3-phosphate acyltransferase C-terminal region
MREEFRILSQLCSKELIVDPLSNDDEIRVKTLGWFHDEGWVRVDDENRISVVNREALESLRGIMSDILEIYYLALVASETLEKGGVALKEFMKRIVKTAQDLRGSDESHPLPSVSSVTVANALACFFEMGILEYRPSRKYLGAVTDAAQREELKNFLGRALRQKISAPAEAV